MNREYIAVVLEETPLTLRELAVSCAVSEEWIIRHVEAGVLGAPAEPDPVQWRFSGPALRRARRLSALERDFDANPELAGLVADLFEELERLRIRLRRAGLGPD
jgi:chaperone modulatory protein CbpM